MRHFFVLFFAFPTFAISDVNTIKIDEKRPADFVDVRRYIPEIQIDMRYFSENNFVGRKVDGYQAPICLLTMSATEALRTVVARLLPLGLTLKVYDCYRPQTAVNDFAKWATKTDNLTMRPAFYPAVDKSMLFIDGYINHQSGHSRGSTVDLTIVPVKSRIPVYHRKYNQLKCTAHKNQRAPDNSLDFGTGFDCFDPASHPGYQDISAQSKANRLLLQTLMIQAGFNPLHTEWWHFTMANEPYPETYFNFPVAESAGLVGNSQ